MKKIFVLLSIVIAACSSNENLPQPTEDLHEEVIANEVIVPAISDSTTTKKKQIFYRETTPLRLAFIDWAEALYEERCNNPKWLTKREVVKKVFEGQEFLIEIIYEKDAVVFLIPVMSNKSYQDRELEVCYTLPCNSGE